MEGLTLCRPRRLSSRGVFSTDRPVCLEPADMPLTPTHAGETTTTDHGRAEVPRMTLSLWPSRSSHAHRRLVEAWTPRIGPQAANALALSQLQGRRLVALVAGWLVLCIFFQVLHLGIAVALSCLLWLPILYYAVAVVRSTVKIQRAAAGYLNLEGQQYKAMPIRGPETFDRWIAARGQPGWPGRFKPIIK
jgi:hypothetical protein